MKKILYETKKRKKRLGKLLYLGENKSDCIEMLISQAITDRIIDHDEFKAIIDEKKDYDNKKNIINEGDKSKLNGIEIV